ncbi:MAG: cell division protein FtsZ [Hyphomicrobiaceae bacterium]|nr:cell division protein FtsZ [Hyphomicrobiaceae bacterium]
MSINLTIPEIQELKPRITVFGVGGAGGNAVNNMINSGLEGVDFVVANTDAQALALSKASRIVQLGVGVTEGLGAGSHPEVGKAAAEESIDEINDHLSGAHMVFITAGMGGGTGTGAAPVVARLAREQGILTVGVVTKPFQFEGNRRMSLADDGIGEMHRHVDTLIVIPNQNLFRVANEKTTFADAFKMADEVLYSGVACITDLMVKEGLINLDFADVRAVMRGMGKAMMGTGEAEGEGRAAAAAEAAISNPLQDDVSVQGARGLLISVTGSNDSLTLYELDEAASYIREQVGGDANIIVGATFDETLGDRIRVSVVATGTEATMVQAMDPVEPNSNRKPITVNRAPQQPAPAVPQPQAIPASAVQNDELEADMASAVSERARQVSSAVRDDVEVEPYIPEAVPMASHEAPVMQERPVPSPYVPQAAQRTKPAARMPRAEELPQPARRQMEEPKKPAINTPHALLKRLASNVGLSLKQEVEAKARAMTGADDLAARNAIEQPQRKRIEPQGAEGGFDNQGRPKVADRQHTEQLEIPSFLKRHG